MDRQHNVARTGSPPYRGLAIRGTADYQSALQSDRFMASIRIRFLEVFPTLEPAPDIGSVSKQHPGMGEGKHSKKMAVVARAGIEPATRGFSIRCSTD